MKNSTLVENVNSEQLVQRITEKFQSQLNDFKKELSNQSPDVLLTRSEACEFLKIDSSTLWAWTNKGKVTSYGISNRRYYKKAELLECLIPLKK